MTQEGATIYYSLKQTFDFQEVCSNFKKLGLYIINPDGQLITVILEYDEDDDFENTSFEKAQALFKSKDFRFYICLENGHIFLVIC